MYMYMYMYIILCVYVLYIMNIKLVMREFCEDTVTSQVLCMVRQRDYIPLIKVHVLLGIS